MEDQGNGIARKETAIFSPTASLCISRDLRHMVSLIFLHFLRVFCATPPSLPSEDLEFCIILANSSVFFYLLVDSAKFLAFICQGEIKCSQDIFKSRALLFLSQFRPILDPNSFKGFRKKLLHQSGFTKCYTSVEWYLWNF